MSVKPPLDKLIDVKKPTLDKGKTKCRGREAGKHKVSLDKTFKYLGLNDNPVPINDHNKEFFEDFRNFEEHYLPLVTSVNKGAHPLCIRTLVKAKWH